MMTLPNTLSEYSEHAAREFLQTVVFVDDRIYDREHGAISELKTVSVPKQRKKAVRSAGKKETDKVKKSSNEHDYDEYSPHDIVNSFAKKQIICSLYQPKRDAKVSKISDIFPLCKAADIVIIDWDLYGDKGQKAKELVDGLIQQAIEDVPEQLRLILVYTQEVNLFDIADQLFQKVSESIGEEIELSLEEGGLAFHTSNSRVSILGKTGRTRPEQYKSHEVEEKDLADRAITEFANLASGLLHATTLLGLAEIKKNSRKILSKFNSSLDPAFLTHRAMLLPDENATNHLIPLLISEIESVLEDVMPNPLITNDIITDWCENVWVPGNHVPELLGEDGLDIQRIATSFCIEGAVEARKKYSQIPSLRNNANIRNASKLLLDSADSVSNHEFSHLMTSRTFYGDIPKTLKLGSVVYEENEKKYLLCLQPSCDCVRLNDKRTFIFAYLQETNENEDKKASHVIVKENGETIELLYKPKSYNCYVAEFSPDSHTKQVRTKKSEDNAHYFIDKENKKYFWIDQLKITHAQRAAEKFARELSRVGLTESEWLRRIAIK